MHNILKLYVLLCGACDYRNDAYYASSFPIAIIILLIAIINYFMHTIQEHGALMCDKDTFLLILPKKQTNNKLASSVLFFPLTAKQTISWAPGNIMQQSRL